VGKGQIILQPTATTVSDLSALIHSPTRNELQLKLQLSQQERDVFRFFGPAALESIREFGLRCRQDRAYQASVLRHQSPLHPEIVPLLAKELADFLISLHTLNASLVGAVDPSFFGKIPQTNAELVRIGKKLTRLTSGELRIVVQSESWGLNSIAPAVGGLGGAGQCLWNALSASSIASWRQMQLGAYKMRLALQPGGDRLLQAGQSAAQEEYSRKLERISTVTLLDGIAQMSPDQLLRCREIGRSQLGRPFARFRPEQLIAEQLSFLHTSEGTRVDVPRDIVDLLASAHHNAWCGARAHIFGGAQSSGSANVTANLLRGESPLRQQLFVDNLSRISGMTLLQALAEMPDSHFYAALNICRGEGSPDSRLVLSTGSHEEVAATSVAKVPERSAAQFINSSRINDAARVAQSVAQELVAQDRRDIETILSYGDAGVVAPYVREICGSLWKVAASRACATRIVASSLLSSKSWEPEQFSHVMGAGQGNALVTLLSGTFDAFGSVLRTHRQQLRQVLNHYAFLGEAASSQQLGAYSERVDRITESVFSGFRRLIEMHTRTPSDPLYTKLGGIEIDDYTRQFLEGYLAAGNHLLVDRSSRSAGEGVIDGAFLFGRAGYIPQELQGEFAHTVGTILTPLHEVSFPELIVTDLEASAGAYQRLYVRRLFITALEGGRFSLGFINTNNQRHMDRAEKIGMTPLWSASIVLKDPQSGEAFTYIPMLLDFDTYLSNRRWRVQ